jgi:hypothetical protein
MRKGQHKNDIDFDIIGDYFIETKKGKKLRRRLL